VNDAAEPESARLTLAKIVRARGRIGEVAAEILTDFPQRLTNLPEVYLHDPRKPAGAQETAPRRVRRCWLSPARGGQAIFHFEGVDSIDEAEKLVGCEVQVPLAERLPLPAAHYYITDLIGCQVWQRSGARLGIVRDVYFPGELSGSATAQLPGTALLAVDTPRGEVLIPLAQEICVWIDTAARRIEVLLPAGLLEINS
jgi:16S rRNA processing protein RimM